MKFFIVTLGCKVNQYESEAISEMLTCAGFCNVENANNADIVVINSCTVTAATDQKMRQILNKIRRENQNCIIIVCGCVPQAFPNNIENLNNADIILGNSNRKDIISSIEEFRKTRKRITLIKSHNNVFEKMAINKFNGRTRAYLKIQDGCNRFCSYCIIPYARGRVRSKKINEIKKEVLELLNNGYKEIVLVGINLSSYGKDLGENLYNAVEAVCSITGVNRVRLGSLEPENLDLDTIKKLRSLENLCPQFHISLQSGCDDTLKRMNRRYTTNEYYNIVKNLKNVFSNVAITTDIMVGFPGESEIEFQESMDFVRKVGFAKAHVFSYSKRPGTKAALYENQVSDIKKGERSKRMISLASDLHNEFINSQIDTVQEVLFEGLKNENYYYGYTPNYTYVKVSSNKDIKNKILKVKITGTEKDYCIGDLV